MAQSTRCAERLAGDHTLAGLPMDYGVEAVAHVYAQREKLRGWRMVHRPKALRHFTATFEPMA